MREIENAERMKEVRRRLLAGTRGPFWRSHRWLVWIAGVLLVLLIAAGVTISVALHHAEPFLRACLVAELEQRFQARVELDSFHVSVMNGLWAEGKGLRIWPLSQSISANGGPPLIRLENFRFHAPLRYQPGRPIYISKVELKGLEVDVPPKFRLSHAAQAAPPTQPGSDLVSFKVGTIECTNARLTLETEKPGSAPLVFAIAHLKLKPLGEGYGEMGFNAELTNPRPPGTIYTHGRFGPWSVEDPGESPINGSYRFEHANLASFKGIAGTLSSVGDYEGTLRDIAVDGRTDTPDFRLSSGGEAMHLRTHFHARVDGTNGDTWLEPVDATLGRSHLTAKGKIVRIGAQHGGATGQPAGHEVALTVNVDRGRIEDFLRLATQGEPLLSGELTMHTVLDVPPGKEKVPDRMRLKGSFLLQDVQFTNPNLQNRIDELSLRGQGKPKQAKNPDAVNVRSAMQSDFQMKNGVITLPNLKYMVPGAEVDLNGTYGIEGGSLSFKGTAKMHATISEMVGGWKGLLLTPLDRLFKNGEAGTAVPVAIEGTRKDPQFTIDFGKFKKTVPQSPADSPGAS
jgi:hypothetical protein